MSPIDERHPGVHRPHWQARLSDPVKVLVCVVALAALGLTASLVTATSNSDPDWIGTAPMNISNSVEKETLHPSIASGTTGQIVAVWNDVPSEDTEPEPDIYVAYSDNRGRVWSDPMQVRHTDDRSQLPHAVIARKEDQEKAFIAWADMNVEDKAFTVYEAELGGGWRQVPLPDADTPSRVTAGPRLAAGPDRLHIVFNAGTGFSHILHSSRALTDTAWSQATRIYTSTDSMSWSPTIAVNANGTDLHVVWEQGFWIWYMYGTPDGWRIRWADPQKLSADVGSVRPDVAASSGGDVHIVWAEEGAESRSYFVRYCRYRPGEEQCSEDQIIDNRPSYVNSGDPTVPAPRLALLEEGDRVQMCVTWHGCREPEPCAEDALLSCSQDGGKTWRSPVRISPLPEGSDPDADISIWPSVAFDSSGTLHGAWQQRVDIDKKDYEIYYAHSLQTIFLPLVIRNG